MSIRSLLLLSIIVLFNGCGIVYSDVKQAYVDAKVVYSDAKYVLYEINEEFGDSEKK